MLRRQTRQIRAAVLCFVVQQTQRRCGLGGIARGGKCADLWLRQPGVERAVGQQLRVGTDSQGQPILSQYKSVDWSHPGGDASLIDVTFVPAI